MGWEEAGQDGKKLLELVREGEEEPELMGMGWVEEKSEDKIIVRVEGWMYQSEYKGVRL